MGDALEKLDWEYHPACMIAGPRGPCKNAASSTATVHTNGSGVLCVDAFVFICTPCLRALIGHFTGKQCPVDGCDRVGVGGFLRNAQPIPVVTP